MFKIIVLVSGSGTNMLQLIKNDIKIDCIIADRECKAKNIADEYNIDFILLKRDLGEISPWKLNVFIIVPVKISAFVLRILFKSSFGDKFMYRHSMKARDEMIRLRREFYGYVLR